MPPPRSRARWPASAAAPSWCSPGRATTAATRSSSRAGCAQWFFDVTVVFRADPARLPADAATAFAAFRRAGGATVDAIPAEWHGTLIVDGLFGIGLARAPSADYAAMIERVNALRAPILALDVPSGLDAETGRAFAPAIRADATATFIALKPGLLTGDGVDLLRPTFRCTRSASTPKSIAAGARPSPRLETVSPPRCRDALRRRVRNVHKGTFGTLGIVGGARGMIGAPLLAGRARAARRRRQGLDRLRGRRSFRPSTGARRN